MVEKSGKADLLEQSKNLRDLIESKNALSLNDIDEFDKKYIKNIESNFGGQHVKNVEKGNKATKKGYSSLENTTSQSNKNEYTDRLNKVIEDANLQISSIDKKT